MATYRLLTGLDYGKPSKRAEAGEVVSDLPPSSVTWLLEQNLVELVEGKKTAKAPAPTVEAELE
jgi:hypothetical protein